MLKINLCFLLMFQGGLGTSTTNWFASLIPPDHIAGMPDILHVTDAHSQLADPALATEVDSKVKTKLLTMWNNVKYGLCEHSQLFFTRFISYDFLIN